MTSPLRRLRTAGWTFSDDPEDPCGLCIVWEESEDDDPDKARPVWPDGSTVPRIYRFTHKSCTEAAIRYSMEPA